MRLRSDAVLFGPWCVIRSHSMTIIIASTGVDFVIIDVEHGATSFETAEDVAWMVDIGMPRVPYPPDCAVPHRTMRTAAQRFEE